MNWTAERLRELAAQRAGDGPSGPAYDPELLEALTEAADALDELERLHDGREMVLPCSKQHAESMLLLAENVLAEFKR